MKKYVVSLLVVSSIIISSCKKDYTCICDTTVRDIVADTLVTAGTKQTKAVINDLEIDAKTVCNNGKRNTVDTSGKFKTIVLCAIK
jgi:hypothetical protein